MNLRAVDLPEVRQSLIDECAPEGWIHRWMRKCGEDGIYSMATRGSEAGDFLAAVEARRLAAADLFHVASGMTDLTIAAAKSLPEFTLADTDLPAPYGLMVFDKPYRRTSDAETGDETGYCAMSWGPTGPALGASWAGYGVFVVWYILPPIDGLPVRLVPETTAVLPFTETGADRRYPGEGSEVDLARSTDTSEWPLKEDVLRTTWLLMQQSLASMRDEPMPRPVRRRLAKAGAPEPRVRVIALRHQSSGSSHTAADRDYHHRWMVKGHWRNQWYPTQERHVPLWISPHIKGPEGAPLLGGEKVYSWRR